MGSGYFFVTTTLYLMVLPNENEWVRLTKLSRTAYYMLTISILVLILATYDIPYKYPRQALKSSLVTSEIPVQFMNSFYKLEISQRSSFIKADLEHLATQLKSTYAAALPFPHVAIDGLFEEQILQEISSVDLDDNIFECKPKTYKSRCKYLKQKYNWQCYGGRDGFGSNLKYHMDQNYVKGAAREVLAFITSQKFIYFLENLTGIKHLQKDPISQGSGMHVACRNSRLRLHADFNRIQRNESLLARRVNVFLYLNDKWPPNWRGQLEFWSYNLRQCQARILPLFNRLAIFTVTDFGYHGHHDPVQSSITRRRKALVHYFYAPAEDAIELYDAGIRKQRNDGGKREKLNNGTIYINDRNIQCQSCSLPQCQDVPYPSQNGDDFGNIFTLTTS